MAQAQDVPGCCPLMEAMDMGGKGGTPPCMEETGDAPMPSDAEATFDGAAQAWALAPPVTLFQPQGMCFDLGLQAENDLVAGSGPALYLLGCSFLN